MTLLGRSTKPAPPVKTGFAFFWKNLYFRGVEVSQKIQDKLQGREILGVHWFHPYMTNCFGTVACISSPDKNWKAYIHQALGRDEAADILRIIIEGAKLNHAQAIAMFPDLPAHKCDNPSV